MDRLCVVVSGQARAFEAALTSLRTEFSHLDCTFIVSTWRARGSKIDGSFGTWAIERVVETEVARALPPYFLHDQIYQKIPGFRDALLAFTTAKGEVTTNQIKSILPEAIVDIQAEDDFNNTEIGYPRNQLKMYYKIWRANQLRIDAEIRTQRPFDYILRIRPDLMISNVNFDKLSECLQDPHLAFVWNSTDRSCDDCICFSQPTVADVYANSSNIRPYFVDGRANFYNGHEILYKNLTSAGISLRDFPSRLEILADRFPTSEFLKLIDKASNVEASNLRELQSLKMVIISKQARNSGDLRYAEQLANEAATLDPNAFAPWYELGLAADMRGEPILAAERLLKASRLVTADCHPRYIFDAFRANCMKAKPEQLSQEILTLFEKMAW